MADTRCIQAYVALRAEDPEATSALEVARAALDAGHGLVALRRFRLFELTGELPEPDEVEACLHRSAQFYNPVKERCLIRMPNQAETPFRQGECTALVFERGGERRPAAERWWRHETGRRIRIRAAVVWAMTFQPGADADLLARALTETRDRRHGLFANPHFQGWRVSGAVPPSPWITSREPRVRKARSNVRGAA